MGECIEVVKQNRVVTLSLNRPDSLNAINEEVSVKLAAALDQAEQDSDAKVIVIKGNGRAFSAGGDIAMIRELAEAEEPIQTKAFMDQANRVIQRMERLGKPIIAAVHGYAFGAGFSLALASDLIVAEAGAKFGLAFAKLGAIPDMGCHYYLTRAVGRWKAKELVWTGGVLTAEDGERLGFVNRLAPPGEAYSAAVRLANELAAGPRYSYQLSKSLLNRSEQATVDEILELESMGQALAFQTKDHEEGVRAFQEKRAPQFRS